MRRKALTPNPSPNIGRGEKKGNTPGRGRCPESLEGYLPLPGQKKVIPPLSKARKSMNRVGTSGHATLLVFLFVMVLASPVFGDAGVAATAAPDGGPAADAGARGPAALPELPPELRPEVKTSVKPTEAPVGGEVELTITLVRKTGDTVRIPSDTSFEPWEVLSRNLSTKTLKDGRIEETYKLRIIAFDPGPIDVPSLSLQVRTDKGMAGVVKTDPQKVTIQSVLGTVPPDAGPRDLHGPVKVIERDWTLIYVLGGLLVVALISLLTLLGRWLWAGRPKKPGPPPPPPRPAEEVAIEKLDALAREHLPERGEMMEYHVRLSDTVREYLGHRYRFDAMEMTTTEVMRALRWRWLNGTLRNLIRSILDPCDLVKFARYAPSVPESAEALNLAYKLVRETTPPTGAPAPAAEPVEPKEGQDAP